MSYETILVPVDLAGGALDVVEHAARVSRAFSSRVVLLYAVELPEGIQARDELEGAMLEERIDREARDELESLQAAFDPATPVKVRLAHGAPVESILEAVMDHGAQLIVMGTHARTGLRRLIFGSVAEEVIRAARVPVLVVHPGDGHDPAAER